MATLKKTVLLVDDKHAIQIALEIILQSMNCRLIHCENVQCARKLLNKKKDMPDLIILDLVMPGNSGYDLLAFMQEKGITIKTVVLSAMDTAQSATRAMKMGAVDYFTKPIDREHVSKQIRRLLFEE